MFPQTSQNSPNQIDAIETAARIEFILVTYGLSSHLSYTVFSGN